MKLKHALTFAALACIGAGASAATTDWGSLGPTPDVAFVTYHTPAPIDDVYAFSLDSVSDVDAYAAEFEARSVSMPGATFTLFSGTFGDAGASQVGSAFTFSNTPTEHVYSSLATGAYFFEVTGTSTGAGSAYDFEASANTPGGGASDAPEPGTAALMLAGLGMVGFISARRRRG